MVKFRIKNIHAKEVSPDIPEIVEFQNESMNKSTEDISPGIVLGTVLPYLKHKIGVKFECYRDASGTHISEMELFDRYGYLLMTLERVADNGK